MRHPRNPDRRAVLLSAGASLVAVCMASARAQTAVGYLIVRNQGRSADRLLSASSPLARAVEMHDSGVDAKA
jgi:copper(I)-binding protein